MKFYSTRDINNQKSVSQAILQGLAEDGGLFVPQYFPQIDFSQLNPNLSYASFASKILAPYFVGDQLANQLEEICQAALNLPLPLQQLNANTHVLELFHGPTLSFKDVGARFLAECMSRLATSKTTIMVATSGDTGSAVASAFYQQNNLNVIVMFPKGQISARQQQQITCWGDNVTAVAVRGSFDDCQRIVKQAFSDNWWTTHSHLSSANSINIARLLPQLTYYAYISWQYYLQYKTKVNFIIPTGNVGNSTAAVWAKQMGFPIDRIALATNANRTLVDYFTDGEFKPRPSLATIANAMDVGNPSNFERLIHLYQSWENFTKNIPVFSSDDTQIRQAIKQVHQQFNYIICPHTATAYIARQQLANDDNSWIIVATAAPCKFETILEPILGETLTIMPQLAQLLERPSQFYEIEANLQSLQQLIDH
jgi:threonine synthase